ncbi:MAG TPA: DUF899 family protein [Paracoccaceae bacterium]|nr:DUF899 family protein [Paracoccaceae bacterium]
MNYQEGVVRLAEYRKQIGAIRQEMRAVQAAIEPQPVEDYVFATPTGPVRLTELFGDKVHLFIIHNMGAGCPYCTLWADGYNGLYEHIRDRAAFFVSSPDAPEAQARFAESRGWRFPMLSHRGSSFAEDMGYKSGQSYLPGISAFVLKEGVPLRVSDTGCGPWDDFNPLWHLFDLIPGGAGDWRPRFRYG